MFLQNIALSGWSKHFAHETKTIEEGYFCSKQNKSLFGSFSKNEQNETQRVNHARSHEQQINIASQHWYMAILYVTASR